MKSIKVLLAAFAVSLMFASCTKEEMGNMQVNQDGEYVGAEVIGTDITVNFGKDTDSKLTGTAWESTDLLGLGWFIESDAVGAVQTGTVTPTNPKMYANHMFQLGADGNLTTKGNVYKGWHFAYYPFERMDQIAQIKEITVNPAQTELYDVDKYNSAFYVSARAFLTKSNVNAQNELKDVVYKLHRGFATVGVTVNPSAAITGSDAMNNLKIKSITLNTGAGSKAFVKKVQLHPNNLPEFVNNPETLEFDEQLTKMAVYDAFKNNGALQIPGGDNVVDEVTTVVSNDEIDLSGAQTLRMFVYPQEKNNLDPEDITFTVEVEGGSFTVEYTDKPAAQLTAAQKANNDVLEAVADAFLHEGTVYGALAKYHEKAKNNVLALTIELTGDMFATDFDNIKSEAEWNKAVKIVDALNKAQATFGIAKKANNTNWKFTDEDGDGNLINLPKTAKITVTGQPMYLAKEGASWPTAAMTVNTNVYVEKDLKVNSVMQVAQDKKIVNKATIYAGPKATISVRHGSQINSQTQSANFENGYDPDGEGSKPWTPATVEAEYGAYVYPSEGLEGTIAYVVEGNTKADIIKTNKMLRVAEQQTGYANVNTLIVRDLELDLNAQATDDVESGDRYDDESITASRLADLTHITVVLENGKLVNKLINKKVGSNSNVGAIVAEAGVNTIDDVTVKGNVEVKEGATLNITNTNTASGLAKSYFYDGNIANYGTLNLTNVSLNKVNDLTNEGNLTVNDGSSIRYSGTQAQTGTIYGDVNHSVSGLNSEFVVNSEDNINDVIENAGNNAEIKLAANLELKSFIEFNSGKKLTFDLNGKNIQNEEGDAIVVTAGELIIKGNGNVLASETASACAVWANGDGVKVTIKGGTYKLGDDLVAKAEGSDNWRNDCIYAKLGEITIEGGKFQYVGENPNGHEFLLNCKDENYNADPKKANIIVKGGEFYKFNPADNAAEGSNTNFIGTHANSSYKYVSTKAEGSDWWVVSVVSK